jgi:hypothetical protein
MNILRSSHLLLLVLAMGISLSPLGAQNARALKRAQYLLIGTIPTDSEFALGAESEDAYRARVRQFIDSPDFYNSVLRYHEKLLGVGLPTDYLDELLRDDIDNKANKVAKIQCERRSINNAERLHCFWASSTDRAKIASCPNSWLQPAEVFWYPGAVAWVCPSVLTTCGADLSRCFVEYTNQEEARNAELGTTEIFDTRFAVVKSLAKQPAGIAAAVVMENYPYTKILEPGVTAIDGSIAHLYRQINHFDLAKLNLSPDLLGAIQSIDMTDTRFQLVYSGSAYEQAGLLTTFGWLRRYEKNRTRANQLYERLLCQKFTSELPRVFPADPGNLRTTPGCMGCHATLDPLADFFAVWGEGGELYSGNLDPIATTFNHTDGSYLSELSQIITGDDAFASCTVENVWKWLMGRGFHRDEADLRRALADYFVTTNYSFKELVYALATHPAFMVHARGNALVSDPLENPPLGEPPGGGEEAPCDDAISFAGDISPSLTLCTSCHGGSGNRQDLSSAADWQSWASQSISMMSSGHMPPGQSGAPRIGPVFEFKEKVRCWVEQGKLDN